MPLQELVKDYMYFSVDRDIVWAVVEHDLPLLKSSIKILLAGDK
jgi:uncharacterized protein with HEPN domain